MTTPEGRFELVRHTLQTRTATDHDEAADLHEGGRMTPYQQIESLVGKCIRELCSDCNAWGAIIRQPHGYHSLEIRHNDTCPTYRAMGRQR